MSSSDSTSPRHLLVALSLATLAQAASAQGPALDARVRWRHEMSGTAITNYVTVAPNGTIYANNNSRLVALDAGGQLLWTAPNTSQRLAQPISLDPDGTIYAGGLGFGQVTALHPDGTLKWGFHPGGSSRVVSGPSRGPDGNIYAVADNFGTYSLDTAGNLRWVGDMVISNNFNSSPLLFDSQRFLA